MADISLSAAQVRCAQVTATVPSITDPDIAKVDATVSGVALGDIVVVAATTALPTNARLQGAYVSATDTVSIVFGSEGGNVVGASRTFNVQVWEKS